MNWGDQVAFAKFIREHAGVRRFSINAAREAVMLQQNDPAMWFRFLAWNAARKEKQKNALKG